MHSDLFKIKYAPQSLGIRTWICRLNFAQRPIFSSLRFFNEPEISDSRPPRGLMLRIFRSWRSPSTSAGFEPVNLGSQGKHITLRPPRLTCRCLYRSLCWKYFWAQIPNPTNYYSPTHQIAWTQPVWLSTSCPQFSSPTWSNHQKLANFPSRNQVQCQHPHPSGRWSSMTFREANFQLSDPATYCLLPDDPTAS